MAIRSRVASAPPTMATSTISARSISQPIPMASLPEAQAEATDRLGPMAPMSIEVMPAAPLAIIIGMTNGLMRRGPLSAMAWTAASIDPMPPTALAIITPTRPAFSGVIEKRDCARACWTAGTARSWNRSRRRFSLASM